MAQQKSKGLKIEDVSTSEENRFMRYVERNKFKSHREAFVHLLGLAEGEGDAAVSGNEKIDQGKMAKKKQLTKGQKQMYDENSSSMMFYLLMTTITAVLHFATNYFVFYQSTSTISWIFFAISVFSQLGSLKCMQFMSKTIRSETGQILDAGFDLNMEGGLGQYCKDMIIFSSLVQLLSIISVWFWTLYSAPVFATYILWTSVISPWIARNLRPTSELKGRTEDAEKMLQIVREEENAKRDQLENEWRAKLMEFEKDQLRQADEDYKAKLAKEVKKLAENDQRSLLQLLKAGTEYARRNVSGPWQLRFPEIDDNPDVATKQFLQMAADMINHSYYAYDSNYAEEWIGRDLKYVWKPICLGMVKAKWKSELK